MRRFVTTGVGSNPQAPYNRFSHSRNLAGPQDTFVTINNDTIYSMAQLDLGVGPVRLHVPDTAGRYYVLQFVDAWTNNFAYVGHRATGTGAGDFLLVPPGWSGDTPAGATVIHVPTMVASIVGRWACAGEPDLPAVHDLQDATTLEPVDAAAVAAGVPDPDPAVAPDLAFWEKLRLWSQAFAPAPARSAVPAERLVHRDRPDRPVAIRLARGKSRRRLAARDNCGGTHAADGSRIGRQQPRGQWLEADYARL